jgi:hypothetical protein
MTFGSILGVRDLIALAIWSKQVCPLGLEVEKIHACENVCMLFCKDDAMLEECHVCGSSRYKQNIKKMTWERIKIFKTTS